MKNIRLLALCAVISIIAANLIGAAEVATVRVAFWGGNEDLAVNTKAAQAFEAKNPGIKIKIEHIPSDYDTKLMTMLAAGNAPDVVQQAEGIAVLAKKGALIPLDGFIRQDKLDLQVYFPTVLQAYQVDKAQYGLPHRWGPMVVYYNRKIFREAGLSAPKKDWTWADFRQACLKTTKGEGANRVWGFACAGTWWPWYMVPIMSFGSPILNEDRNAPAFDKEKAAKALEFLHDLIWKDRVNPTPAEMSAYQMGNDQLFEAGKVAMNMTGFWAINGLLKSGIEWDVAWMPKGERQVTTMFGACWAMTKDARNKNAAWKVLKFFAGPEYAKILAEAGHDIPSIIKVAYSPTFLNRKNGPSEKTLRTIIDMVSIAEYPPISEKWNVLNDVTWPIVEKYYKNEIPSARAAIEEMEAAIRKGFALQ
ncbi:MAG: sugar ABC transporter substrate-binding protein [Firmicutes bacterium]|nr:sugar ABC transporter substrate-binding protein [Bacillota bacterium]